MITVSFPNNNVPEREYAILSLFEIIGCEVSVSSQASIYDYIISWKDRKIIVHDGFWNQHKEPLSYLDKSFFPLVSRATNKFTVEDDIIVLYGNDCVEVKNKTIECGIDIFASSFFMLTRWEEYVNTKRDNHNRFVAIDSVAYNEGFLERPIVNEYAELLWNMMSSLDGELGRKRNGFEIIPTHDIDYLYHPHRAFGLLKLSICDVLKRSNFTQAFNHLLQLFQNDPIDTIDFIMDVSEESGLKSHFFFMSTSWRIDKKRSSDYIYSRKFKKTIRNITRRGHYVGFHPGYFSYNNDKQWRLEKELLEEQSQLKIVEGRQHYLMCSLPTTLSIWADSGMEMDSTLSYSDRIGFRCGTGNKFFFYDFLNRKRTQLKELPLIAMDKTLVATVGVDGMKHKLQSLFTLGERYSMPITILFHNTIFGEKDGMCIRNIYQSALKALNE